MSEERLAKENQLYDLEQRMEQLHKEIKLLKQDLRAKERKLTQMIDERYNLKEAMGLL